MAPHNDNEDDDQPVSFQELKKRWAQHEANSSSPQQQHQQQPQQPQQQQQQQQQQEQSPPPVIPDTSYSSPTPTPTPPPPQSNAVNSKPIPPRSPIQRVANVSGTMHKASSAPPIPPKPPTATIRMPTPMKAPTDPSVVVDMSINKQQQKEPKSSVSVIAKQLEGQHITKSPSLSSSSSAAVADISESPSPLQQDPFCDEEEASDDDEDDDDSSSCTSTATSNSEDSEVDDELVRKVQMRYSGVSPAAAIRTPPPPPKDASTTTAKKSGSTHTPPPPPPPSKKYHSVARSIDIPKTSSPVDSSPPSLPPRPCALGKSYSEMDQQQPQHSNTMPVLPPRPSPSVIARSHTTSNHRSTSTATPASTPQRSASARKAFKNFSHATGVYPDLSEASRKKPFINGRDRRIPTGHRGTIRAIAVQGACLATGAHETRIWNTDTSQCLYSIDANPGETNDKVSALAFAPPRHPRDEGTQLWIGHRDGELLVVDTLSGRTIEKLQQQQQAITAMLRYRNTELWTIDESGLLCIWDAYDMHIKEQRMVMPRSVTALLRGRDLWMASGRTLQMFPEHGSTHQSEEEKRIRIPNDLGNITQMATMSHHPGKVFVAHDNGKVSIWDAFTLEKRETMMVSMYGITAMVAVGEYYLWMGYNTGMIYAYDTRPERWVVIKAWRAHHSAIVSLQVEDIGIALGDETVQVVSADSHGYVALWDGLLPEHWKDHQMAQYKHDYCTERDMNLLICSWNIDANKPEKLSASDDQRIREWLASMEDPDIIVVGIQEIVDLESKKQTARSLFASRKKVDTLQEANELLTHRYSLWHDYLVQLIYETHPYNEYTVIKTDQLVGLFSCIFVKTSELRHVSLVESTVVKTGLKVMHKSLHGNKGGIAIRFRVQDSTLCFVNCHLAAGQSHTQQRNSDAEGILQTAEFHAFENNDAGIFANGGDGSMILDHEHCFLSGDLNYRINMSRERVLQLLAGYDPEQSFDALQREDQLLKQRITNPLFKLLLFNEPRIDFLPTYKYDPGTDYYDRSEKKRVPAWCDRILYRSRDAHNLFYQRHEVLASDHRPISSGFVIRIKQVDRSKQRQVAFHVDEAWHHHYSRLVQAAKIAYIMDFGFMDHDTASKQLEAAQWDVARVMDQAAM